GYGEPAPLVFPGARAGPAVGPERVIGVQGDGDEVDPGAEADGGDALITDGAPAEGAQVSLLGPGEVDRAEGCPSRILGRWWTDARIACRCGVAGARSAVGRYIGRPVASPYAGEREVGCLCVWT